VLQSCTNLTTFCHEPATFLAMPVRGKNMLFVARSQAAGPFKGVVWWHTNLTLGRDDVQESLLRSLDDRRFAAEKILKAHNFCYKQV
jgi:hypothetical protein